MTLDEQVAKAKNWSLIKKGKDKGCWYDQETDITYVISFDWERDDFNWSDNYEDAFELVEEMANDCAIKHILPGNILQMWEIKMENGDVFQENTFQEAVCKAYITWKKVKK